MQPVPRGRSPLPTIIIVVLVLGVAGVCGFVSFIGYVISRAKTQYVDQMNHLDDNMMASLEESPSVTPEAMWHGDVLSVKLTFSCEKQEYKKLQVTSLLLDKYLPQKKTPLTVPAFGPHKPVTIVVTFPGFDGRGGKYAKLNVAYQENGGGPKDFDMDPGPMPDVVVAKTDRSQFTWSSSYDNDIYVPLRGGSKSVHSTSKHRK